MQSREYSRFIPNACNRPASDTHIKQIADSMKAHGFIATYPLVVRKVGEKFAILDGQHRFAAAQSLGHPVYYVVTDADIDASVLNCTQKPWTPRDFAGAYAQQGNTEYQVLLHFAEQHGLPLTAAATLLGGKQGTAGRDLREGRFAIPSREAAEAVAQISDSLRAAGVHWARHSNCLKALRLVVDLPRFSLRQMIDRIATHPALLKPQVDRNGYIELFSTLYNYKTVEANRLPLSQMASDLLRRMHREGCARGVEARNKKAA